MRKLGVTSIASAAWTAFLAILITALSSPHFPRPIRCNVLCMKCRGGSQQDGLSVDVEKHEARRWKGRRVGRWDYRVIAEGEAR